MHTHMHIYMYTHTHTRTHTHTHTRQYHVGKRWVLGANSKKEADRENLLLFLEIFLKCSRVLEQCQRKNSRHMTCVPVDVSLFIVFFFFYFVTWKSWILFQDIQISTSHQWNVQVFQSVGAMSEKEQSPYDLCAGWHVSLFIVFFFFYFVTWKSQILFQDIQISTSHQWNVQVFQSVGAMSEKEQSPYDLCAGWHVSLFIVFFFFYFVTWKSQILFQDIQISTSHQWNVQVFQSVGAMSEKEQSPYDLCASWHVSLFVVFFFFYFVPVSPCAVGQVFFCFVNHICETLWVGSLLSEDVALRESFGVC